MKSVRLAIATSDGTSVAAHLARSASFLVIEVEDGRVVSSTLRDRGTGQGGSHRSFKELLAGCRDLICGGISESAESLLSARGTESLVLAAPMSVQDALASYLAGTLATSDARVCL